MGASSETVRNDPDGMGAAGASIARLAQRWAELSAELKARSQALQASDPFGDGRAGREMRAQFLPAHDQLVSAVEDGLGRLTEMSGVNAHRTAGLFSDADEETEASARRLRG